MWMLEKFLGEKAELEKSAYNTISFSSKNAQQQMKEYITVCIPCEIFW